MFKPFFHPFFLCFRIGFPWFSHEFSCFGLSLAPALIEHLGHAVVQVIHALLHGLLQAQNEAWHWPAQEEMASKTSKSLGKWLLRAQTSENLLETSLPRPEIKLKAAGICVIQVLRAHYAREALASFSILGWRHSRRHLAISEGQMVIL